MDTFHMMKSRLTRLESRLQAIIEGSAAWLFPSKANQNDLAEKLIAAMQSGVKTGEDGQMIAPNLFILVVHPDLSQVLSEQVVLLEGLIQSIQEFGSDTGLRFLSPPVLRIQEDIESDPAQIQVKAQISLENLAQTSDLAVDSEQDTSQIPANAYLIVNGTQMFLLNQSVVNIGRRADNQLVINDARISRVHAQLRAIKGRYAIFDLDSTGGTFVNDQRVHHGILFPGDVISLAGIPLVFGQDSYGLSSTQKYSPVLDH
jgi:pSer/pThr/pTyr-binding forkhead associated (FHA) protein